nr:hypothetical protein KS05_06860 [Rhizobium brockwellii]
MLGVARYFQKGVTKSPPGWFSVLQRWAMVGICLDSELGQFVEEIVAAGENEKPLFEPFRRTTFICFASNWHQRLDP